MNRQPAATIHSNPVFEDAQQQQQTKSTMLRSNDHYQQPRLLAWTEWQQHDCAALQQQQREATNVQPDEAAEAYLQVPELALEALIRSFAAWPCL
jgi:hypothetical protein